MTQTIDLALMFEDSTITIGPRDVASQAWLVDGGDIHCAMPLAKIREHWQNRGISRRDLASIAAHFEQELNVERMGYEHGAQGTREEVRFRVRACEYRDVLVSQKIVEINR